MILLFYTSGYKAYESNDKLKTCQIMNTNKLIIYSYNNTFITSFFSFNLMSFDHDTIIDSAVPAQCSIQYSN
jgi:hypothetical protein